LKVFPPENQTRQRLEEIAILRQKRLTKGLAKVIVYQREVRDAQAALDETLKALEAMPDDLPIIAHIRGMG